MDAKLVEIGVQFRKFVVFSFKILYRSVCRNPFLVCMLFFLIFLYRFFPFLFSLLLSASPVLVSTAVLLGTLLSFGHPNIPEIEKEESVTDEILSLKTGFPRDSLVVEGDSSRPIERYTRKERGVEDKSIEETSSLANNVSEVDRDESVVPTSPEGEENSREFQFENRVNEEADRELNGEKLGNQKGNVNQYSLIQQSGNENDESETDKSPEGSVDSPMGEDHLNFSSGLPLKEDEEEEEEEERSDSGSDGDESSSPDASMADIIPMLDELHPLLDEEEAIQPAHMSNSGSDADVDAASQHSSRSGKSGNGSDPDSETREDLEVVEDEEEEETHGDKEEEEEAKAAITWTEDDEKNLMNLGTSELERNRRLESLIARRRSRKNMRMMAEKNLIDFESTDLPFNVASISTSRKNPFDLPFDSNDNIPGSAPSILLPRRNPFDLPYDSSEEKPDLVGDTFLQDSITFQPKEQPVFRRHESFNVGPSLFGGFRHEKQDIKLRPYFVPERIEEPNFSFLQRQSSEMSESKASSVPETESVGSAGDMEDKKLIEEDLHASQRIGHASESSEDVDSVDFVQVEKRDVERRENVIKLGGEESHQETESHLSETGSVVNLVELSTNVADLNIEAVDQKNISRSSSSSDADVNEKIFNEKEDGLLSLEQTQANVIEEPEVLIEHKEPIYDLSPTLSFKKEPSSSSVSSDPPVEVLDTGFLPVIVKKTVSLDENNIDDASIDQEDSSDTSVDEDSLHKDRSLGVPEEERSLVGQEVSVTQPVETEAIEENLIDKEVVLRYEHDQVHPSNVDDKSMNPSSDITEELKEPLIIVRGSIDEASPSHSSNVSEAKAVHSVDTETELPPALADLNDSILNGLENADETREINSTDSHINLQNNIKEQDEIKEIDEGLLSELDAVGDFSVKDSGSYLNEVVKHPVQEDSTAVLETNDIPLKIEEEISKYKAEMSQTSSIDDDDSSIQEVVHREVENPEDFKSVDDKAEDSGVKQNLVAEMHAVEDFEPGFEKVEPVSVETEVGHVGAEIEPVMHVLEARSVADIDLPFKQVSEKEIEKAIAVKSSQAKPTSLEDKDEILNNERR